MARLKHIFGRELIASRSSLSFFSTKPPSNSKHHWQDMSYNERVNYAMDELEPKSADIAFYQGLGFLVGELSSIEKSVAAFKAALKLSEGSYWPASIKLAQIYAELGNYKSAYLVLNDAVATLHRAIESNDRSLGRIRSWIMNSQPSHKFQEKPFFLPHNNEHNEEKLWLACYDAAHYYAKLGELPKAYQTLISAKDYLEHALLYDRHAFEYLREQLVRDHNFTDEPKGVAKFV